MIQGVVFDIENTLLEPVPHITETIGLYLQEHGNSVSNLKIVGAYCKAENWIGSQLYQELKTGALMPNNQYLRHILDCYCASLDLSEDAAFRDFLASHLDAPTQFRLKDGVTHLLETLSEKGILCAIASNSPSSIRNELERVSILPYFQSIVLSEEAKFVKPDLRLLKLACSEMGLPAKDCIYIGDNAFDILCAYLAGMPAMFCPYRIDLYEIPDYIPQPDWIVSDMADAEKQILSLLHEKAAPDKRRSKKLHG